MSVESTITKVIYSGNGVATEWPVPFKYNKPDHLHLLVTDAKGAHELVTSNFQVQVTEAGDTSILYPVSGQPLAAGKRLTIFRATPQTQIVDLIYGGAFAPEVLEEDGLDREVMMIQELQEGLDRAVKVGIDADETPEELLENIFTARNTAVDSATSAQASANAAAESARAAAGSAANAAEEREAACICAGEARDARDVAIAQTEAANTLMEAELAKVNAIVAANRTDQQAAVTAARQWAEKAPDTPVDYDEEGHPRYSARHWSKKAQESDLNPDGVTLALDDDGVLHAMGGHLLLNSEQWITASCTWEAPVTGWYNILAIGGGNGGRVHSSNIEAYGGASGEYKFATVFLKKGQKLSIVIGSGGIGSVGSNSEATVLGGITTVEGVDFSHWSDCRFRGVIESRTEDTVTAHCPGAGLGGAIYGPANATWYGGGGGAISAKGGSGPQAGNGYQGVVVFRYYDPAKANGPAPSIALMALGRSAKTPTVNLYDPATGQGSVWREEDAPAKLAEGLITEAAWTEICDARAAEAYAAWLASPETEPERFELLRLACEARLTATDKLTTPDYPISDEDRAAVNAYRKAIRELNHQPGAPWDGGGELTPWPEEPRVSKVQG